MIDLHSDSDKRATYTDKKCENAMNLFADIRTVVINSLDALVADGTLPSGLSFDNVAVEPPRDAAHGDMA
ncbi:MAG: hypothetical protein ACI8Z0_002330, partial [Lentimonas sp.]